MTYFKVRELILDKLVAWSYKPKALLFFFGFLLMLAASYCGMLRPLLHQYDVLSARESLLRREFDLKQHQTSNVRVFREHVREMDRHFHEALTTFASHDRVPELLDNMTRTGVSCGLLFESLVPLPEKPREFYRELPIKMVVLGSYRQFVVFFRRVTTWDHLVTWHDFVMTKSVSAHPLDKDTLRLTITAKLYVA